MDLKPDIKNIEKIFTGDATQYRVPLYQRDYSWTIDNVDELWADISTSLKNNSEYFMGTVVLNVDDNCEDVFDIVDGQQRLATFTILFSTIRDLMELYNDAPTSNVFSAVVNNSENKKIASKIGKMASDRILFYSEPDNYYLKLNKKDKGIFEKNIQTINKPLVSSEELKVKPHDNRLIKTKKTFAKKIVDDYISSQSDFTALRELVTHVSKKLKFMTLIVKNDYDAYLLFESLNSKGLDLSIADLLKNKMLMTCDSNDKGKVLDNWDRMIDTLEKSRFSPVDFLRFYWVTYHKNVTKKELYKCIKEKLTKSSVVKFSSHLLKNAEAFSIITNKDLLYPSLDYKSNMDKKHFAEINTLKYSVCYPYILWCYENNSKLLSLSLPVIVNYLFRLISVCDIAVGIADATFSKALIEAKTKSPNDSIVKLFNDAEIADTRFRDKMKQKQFYDNTIPKYILTKIYEHELGKETIIHKDSVHLEHILPQEYKKNWNDFDSGDHQIEDWIYCIGNMTLIDSTLNQSASNSKFSDKIKRYKQRTMAEQVGTNIPITYKLHDQYKSGEKNWTAERIKSRASEFANLANMIWKLS